MRSAVRGCGVPVWLPRLPTCLLYHRGFLLSGLPDLPTKTEAEPWLTRAEADLLGGDWLNPDDELVSFGEYASDWIEERPCLRPSKIEVYRYLLNRHLMPALGSRPVADIREAQVRRWRKNLVDSGASAASAAKAHRLHRAIMNTAVDDGITRRNLCRRIARCWARAWCRREYDLLLFQRRSLVCRRHQY